MKIQINRLRRNINTITSLLYYERSEKTIHKNNIFLVPKLQIHIIILIIGVVSLFQSIFSAPCVFDFQIPNAQAISAGKLQYPVDAWGKTLYYPMDDVCVSDMLTTALFIAF